MQCRELVAMGDNVAYGIQRPFTIKNGLAQETDLVPVTLEAKIALRGEQFEVRDQLSQAIRMDYQGGSRHECVEVETFEGGMDMWLARLAVVLALHNCSHLVIGYSLSVCFQQKGRSRGLPVHSWITPPSASVLSDADVHMPLSHEEGVPQTESDLR